MTFMPWVILKRGSEDLSSEVLAIHAALLPTNQILLFGGDEFNPAQLPGAVDNSRLFFFIGGDNTWRHRDLSAESGAPGWGAASGGVFSCTGSRHTADDHGT